MIITLTTDFGLSDPFVGIMKGVIFSIVSDVQIVDITHDIRSYDILEAAFVLKTTYSYFPAGTIHVVVVDPGVGSARHPLAAFSQDHYFVAPDNGVLSFVLDTGPPNLPTIHRISNESLFQGAISRTFHGRDIFAPTAAHLARGAPIDTVGERILDFVKKPLPRARPRGENGLLARVLRIDKFGNIVTDLRRDDLHDDFVIRVAGLDVTRLCESFSEADPSEFFAIEGSTGYIEIALNQGSAAERLNVPLGTEIEVETGSPNH